MKKTAEQIADEILEKQALSASLVAKVLRRAGAKNLYPRELAPLKATAPRARLIGALVSGRARGLWPFVRTQPYLKSVQERAAQQMPSSRRLIQDFFARRASI